MLMTQESKINFKQIIEETLEFMTKEIDETNNLKNAVLASESLFSSTNLQFESDSFKNILNFKMFLGIVGLDLCASLLIYINGKSRYEGIFSCRQIIVIISEGYKKLYNFTRENEKGDIISKYRNRSFWVRSIGKLVDSKYETLKPKYDSITQKLDDYLNINFDLLYTQRNLSIHYDEDPTLVYNMIVDLDVDETFKKLAPFMDIINNMFLFINDLVTELGKEIKVKGDRINARIAELTGNINKLIADQNILITDKLKTELQQIKSLLQRNDQNDDIEA